MNANRGRVQENLLAYCACGGYVESKDNVKSGNRLHLLYLSRRALMSRLLSWTAAFAVLLYSGFSRADTFGSGANSFDIDFVTVGNPGNPADANPNPAGAVPYVYRIGKYEISEQMIDKANALGALGTTKDTRGPDYPATSVTWYEAAKFVNWLDSSSGSVPAYKFDGS